MPCSVVRVSLITTQLEVRVSMVQSESSQTLLSLVELQLNRRVVGVDRDKQNHSMYPEIMVD
jgi:hypothetical protein